MSLPRKIEEAMSNAIAYLVDVLRCQILDADTHRVLIVTGWNNDSSTRQAIAHYLVGLRACAIDAALNIRAELEDTLADRVELRQSILKIIGASNETLTDDQKQDERNPWMAEGLWQLCMVIAARRPEIHPVGGVVAVNYAHTAAKDHGLDVAAIYESNNVYGLSLIESKAYKQDPNQAISKAVDYFKAIDRGEHAPKIRQTVQIMRTALPAEQQERIPMSFWKRMRSYLPNPHYDAGCTMNWTNTRPSFRELTPDRLNIIIMPHIITNFDTFFDTIADEMRAFVRSL